MTGLWRQAQLEAGLPTGVHAICNFGCTPELWSVTGKHLFNLIRADQPDMAMSVYHGSEGELEGWMAVGHTDMCLTREPVARRAQTILPLPADELVLYSDRAETPIRADSKYVFVDHGEEFRRRHGEAYYDAGTARLTFNSSSVALEFLLETGGSAYLPRALVEAHPRGSTLHAMTEAPVFDFGKYLILSDAENERWDWLPGVIERLG